MTNGVGGPVILLSPMGESGFPIAIPKGTLMKAAEVCDLVKVQPYVLRSWEGEFPGLGLAKTAGGPRVYRRTDVEQVLRIKHLLLVEGLTLAGARRRLEEEAAPPPPVESVIDAATRERLVHIQQGLRSILDLLTAVPAGRPPLKPLLVASESSTGVLASSTSEGDAETSSDDDSTGAQDSDADEPTSEWSLSQPALAEPSPAPRAKRMPVRSAAPVTSGSKARASEPPRKESGGNDRTAARRKR